VEAFIDSNVILKYIIVSETIYGYIRLTTNLKPYELKKKFHKLQIDFTPVYESLSDFVLLPLSITLNELKEIIGKCKLLPNDALIALTCKHYGITKIATFDDDFKRVSFLEVLSI